jgi:hypothetical protein
LVAETRAPIPPKPGRPARHDYEYLRNGVANLFMMFAPLEGWRRVEVTDHHAAVDYANVLKDLSDVHFPAAEKIVLVQDNLSTHTPASLYAARQADPGERSRGLGDLSKQTPRQSRLAIHNRKRSRQTEEAVPPVSMTRATRAARSILSNISRQLTPRLRMGRTFMRCMTSAIASLHSASGKNVSPRTRPRI